MKEVLDRERIPRHIAIIMDGNGRWAKKKGAMRIFGHRHAIQAVKDAIEGAENLGVKYLTLFSFSTENWSRPQDEVNGLMELLVKTITDEVPMMMNNNIRLESIGDIDSLPPSAYEKLMEAKKITSTNSGLTVILALSYSGQWELTQATKRIAQKISEGKLKVEDINQNLVAEHLETAGIPDPELMIRTSGEYRISNFLLWQLAYTELHFTPVLWPDFRREHLEAAILDFQKRERRFGKTGEQVKP
ncbi:MAG TPA: isoprenyl transferase [Algoriphagus sp.]|jgi:undecaprenyl diphosphate synthase|uniref:Isoprenyl transferase n=3 Tax=Algoriphagus TaxID=246875 RepID=A0A1I5ERS0_9BACT|nr:MULTISPECIES: isoprenyl transferase [Algoriphagus]MAL12362.1 isoprenyl transferase [Algoriphagus sp.]QYH40215.1 isoprenyl transferase [Algoriphagus sp. NBT04N3]SFO14139.1 Undecaprenyl pyrophosphate synthetase [Algoriphagus ornithinivorans]HAD50537.1 isoprenyl transferase [Algoriphagus sp.]HAS59317.1 isoprenyl transferase [Algoriphagus sp.]|tara:strand:+ start:10346 stop:11083 length:738 start_codon:yes stop_codon:yes gene_type:complete